MLNRIIHLFQVLAIKFRNILKWEVGRYALVIRIVKEKFFSGQQLSTLDEKIVGQWRMYFNLKAKFYLAEVRFFLGKQFRMSIRLI